MIIQQEKAGTVDVSVIIRIIDSTDGTPETGVVFNTSGIDLEYRRDGAASVDITEATLSALTDAHSDGGFLHIGNGYYRLDLPDAACATGAKKVIVHGTVTGMIVIGCVVHLIAVDLFDTVRLGLTALPNAAAEAAGGLYTRGTGAGQINQDANGRIDTNIAAVSTDATAADTLESYLDGGAVIPANVTQISGDATAADNAEAYFDGTGYKDVDNLYVLRTATAQAGAAGNITLDASASAVDDFYNNTIIQIIGGTGIAQSRIISDYVGATKVATVNGNWVTNPDNTSVFIILPFGAIPGASAPTAGEVADAVWDEAKAGHVAGGSFGEGVNTNGLANNVITAASINADAITAAKVAADVHAEAADAVWDEVLSGHIVAGSAGQRIQPIRANTAQAGAAGSITFDASANASDDFYNGALIHIISGTGAGQARVITDYNGTTKAATVDSNWITNPSSDSLFIILPGGGATITGTVDANVTEWGGVAIATPDTTGYPVVTVKDGTGQGELSTASGRVLSDVTHFGGSAITSASGRPEVNTSHLAGSAVSASSGLINANVTQVSGDSTAADNLEAGFDGTGYKDIDNEFIIRSSTAQAGGASTITLDASASAVDDFYNNALIQILSGTGIGQARFITDYVGATKVATVGNSWATNPSSDSVFAIRPFGAIPGATAPSASEVAVAVWDEALTGHTDADTTGERLGRIPNAAAAANGGLPTVDGDNFIAGIQGTINELDTLNSGLVTEHNATQATLAALNNVSASDVLSQVNSALNAAIADSVPADGSIPSVRQALYMLAQFMFERSVSGTTVTVKKVDGSTSLMTFTINQNPAPTSITRS